MNFRDALKRVATLDLYRARNSRTTAAWVLAFWLMVYLIKTTPEFGIVLIAIFDLALIGSLVTGLGRNPATWVLAVLFNGVLLTAGFKVVMPQRHDNPGAPTLSRRDWIAARRADSPALAAGQRLANSINDCVAKYRENFTDGSYPQSAAQLKMVNCQTLLTSQADSAAGRKRYSPDDFGWRWTYTPAAPDSQGRISQYKVRVFEDPALALSSVQYASDATTAVWEYSPGNSPVLVATPIATLREVGQCIAEVPGLRAKDDPRVAPYRNFASPLDELLSRCPELRAHVESSPLSHGVGHIAFTARGANGKLVDTVSVFSLGLIPVDEKHFIYEFSSGDITSGSLYRRSYFGARDGSIHVATGRPATSSDPVIAAQ